MVEQQSSKMLAMVGLILILVLKTKTFTMCLMEINH